MVAHQISSIIEAAHTFSQDYFNTVPEVPHQEPIRFDSLNIRHPVNCGVHAPIHTEISRLRSPEFTKKIWEIQWHVNQCNALTQVQSSLHRLIPRSLRPPEGWTSGWGKVTFLHDDQQESQSKALHKIDIPLTTASSEAILGLTGKPPHPCTVPSINIQMRHTQITLTLNDPNSPTSKWGGS